MKLHWEKKICRESNRTVKSEETECGPFVFRIEHLEGDKTFFLLVSVKSSPRKDWWGALHTDFNSVANAKQYVEGMWDAIRTTTTPNKKRTSKSN